MSTTPPEQLAICPVCMRRTLGQHCPSSTCSWHRCRSALCKAVLDLRAKRGFRMDRAGAATPIQLGGT